MTETEQTVLAEPTDPEATLVAPRFDVADAQTAQPVVPLAVVRPHRIWPLLLLSALLGGAVSLFGLYLYQRPLARKVVVQSAVNAQPTNTTPASPMPTATTAPVQIVAQADTPRTDVRPPETQATEQTSTAPIEPPKQAEHVVETKHVQAKPGAAQQADKQAEQEQSKGTGAEVRPRLVETKPTPDLPHRDDQPRTDRTHNDQAQPATLHKRSRNVDRIRDIFEGPPPV
jgi:hypothetical protein